MAISMDETQDHNQMAELDWLSNVLGGSSGSTTSAYLCRPNSENPQVLLPVSPRSVAAAAVNRSSSDSTVSDRLMSVGAGLAARLGLLGRAPGERLVLPKYAAIDELERRLGEPTLIASIGLGPRRRNRKPVIQLIRPDGNVVGYAKVGWSDLTRQLVDNETRWLRTVEGHLPNGVIAPTVLLHMKADSWPGESNILVSAALKTTGSSRGAPELTDDLAMQIARITKPKMIKVAALEWLLSWKAGPLSEYADAILTKHGSVPIQTAMWHGDLTPWNTSTSNGSLLIWDWEFSDQDRPLGFDTLHREFENVRRSGPESEAAAVTHIRDRGEQIVRPFNEAAEATVDLYLLELLAREFRLAGQGWEPGHIGHLSSHLADALNARLDLT